MNSPLIITLWNVEKIHLIEMLNFHHTRFADPVEENVNISPLFVSSITFWGFSYSQMI